MKAQQTPRRRVTVEDGITTIKEGNIAVKIYEGKNRIYRRNPDTGERGLKSEHPQYTLTYYDGSERVRRKFVDLAKAKDEADLAITKLANGENEALRLTGADRNDYVRAMQKLREWQPDANLNHSVDEYVAAMKRLPVDVSLKECVDFYLRRHPCGLPPKTPKDVAAELVESKRRAGKSAVYIKDLEGRLAAFSNAFNVRLAAIEPAQVEDFLRSLNRSPRTQNNYRRIIGTLFKFAVKRGYLPRDHSTMDGVEKADDSGGEIEIFTPDELQTLFDHARPEMIPYLSIAAFAGLRATEIQRLDWSEVNLKRRFIEVKASKAKTASRRLAPITDNLAAWLAPHERDSGPVMPFENMSKQLVEILAPAAGLRWKRNGLRHSFISFRLAAIKDIGQVALEAGNSPQMIFKHYRELVAEDEAAQWFGIMPPKEAENVVPMADAATA